MAWGDTIKSFLFHPVEVLAGTYPWPKTANPSGVDVKGLGPTEDLASNPNPSSNQTWGDWLSSKFTGAGEATGSFTGKTLAATITPLLPILIILLVVYIIVRVAAEKVIP